MPKGRILVVDDDENMLNLLQVELANVGYEVQVTSNAKESIEIAKAFQPKLVIMDLVMPEMDGAEAADMLFNDSETGQLSILFLTGTITQDEQSEKGLKIGERFCPTLAKPFKLEQLARMVDDFFESFGG